MIIDALVKIELALDGTYKIVQLRPYTPEDCQPPKASEYLANAQSVREHQRAASAVRAHARSYPTHGHCSICGACGKKASTHTRNSDRHFLRTGETRHRGEPFTGEAC